MKIFRERKDLQKYLRWRFLQEKKKWMTSGADRYGWTFSITDKWVFKVDWNRDLGAVLGHCSTRVVVEKKGWIYYNIYCWDFSEWKRPIYSMSTWIWNRMTEQDKDDLEKKERRRERFMLKRLEQRLEQSMMCTGRREEGC